MDILKGKGVRHLGSVLAWQQCLTPFLRRRTPENKLWFPSNIAYDFNRGSAGKETLKNRFNGFHQPKPLEYLKGNLIFTKD